MKNVSEILKVGGVVCSVGQHESAFRAIEVMSYEHQSAVVVMDGAKLVGIVSEQDISRRLILKGLEPKQTLVKEVMTQTIFSVESSTPVDRVLAQMNTLDVRHMPVIHQGKVVGFVSILDIVEAMLNEKNQIINKLEEYVSETWPI